MLPQLLLPIRNILSSAQRPSRIVPLGPVLGAFLAYRQDTLRGKIASACQFRYDLTKDVKQTNRLTFLERESMPT